MVKGAAESDNPGIFSDGGTAGFPGPLTLRRSFAARHLGLKPPQLFSKPVQVTEALHLASERLQRAREKVVWDTEQGLIQELCTAALQELPGVSTLESPAAVLVLLDIAAGSGQ
jgi:hypothetical protein